VYQAAGVDGVQAAYALCVEALEALWKNPDTGALRSIRVLAFRPEDPVFLDAEIDRQRVTLAPPDVALVDVKSKRLFGPLATGVVTELSRRRIQVVGTFALGTDFAYDGNVILSDRNFLRYFPHRRATND